MQYVIDAKNQKLGRLASQIAVILQGKKTPAYNPRLIGKDTVVVKNSSQMAFTGDKENKKIYYRHTGYMGHLRERLLKEAMIKSPEQVLRHAVEHMLPKNWIRAKRLNMLKIEK